jgi:SAM-dependent methyltransferase
VILVRSRRLSGKTLDGGFVPSQGHMLQLCGYRSEHTHMKITMQANQPDDLVFDGDIHDSQFSYLFQRRDISFWVALAHDYGPRVLELACGTGRITLPIAFSGVAIDGLDFSESMLQRARERATIQGAAITFYHADIRQLAFDAAYDFIFLPSGTFLHLLTRTDVADFLAGVRRALTPKGMLAIDVHNPTTTWLKVLPLPSSPKETSFQHRSTQEHIRVATTDAYHADRQVLTQSHRYMFPDGAVRESTVVLKLYFPVELESLLYYNGFSVQHTYGGYDQEPFTAESIRQIILARPMQ